MKTRVSIWGSVLLVPLLEGLCVLLRRLVRNLVLVLSRRSMRVLTVTTISVNWNGCASCGLWLMTQCYVASFGECVRFSKARGRLWLRSKILLLTLVTMLVMARWGVGRRFVVGVGVDGLVAAVRGLCGGLTC